MRLGLKVGLIMTSHVGRAAITLDFFLPEKFKKNKITIEGEEEEEEEDGKEHLQVACETYRLI